MEKLLDITAASGAQTSGDCWNTIGVRGDRSCPELKTYTHCRNCPVYGDAALRLLEGEASPDYITDWTWHFGAPETAATERHPQSVVIFRIGTEWLALATPVVKEIAAVRPVHTVPHRRGVIEGLTSVHGQLLVSVSLGKILALASSVAPDPKDRRSAHERLLVAQREDVRVVFRVDDVHGVHHFHTRELKEVPATVARATATYSKSVLPWNGHSVGVLDDGLLFYTLKRSLA